MSQFIVNRFNKPPTNGKWKISNFSILKSPESAYFGFYIPMNGNGPEFNIFLIPRKHPKLEYVKIVIGFTEAYKNRNNIPSEFHHKNAQIRLSFINGRGEKCNTLEATMPLYANPERFHEHDAHFEVPYDYLLHSANDLLEDSMTLTIYIEGKLVPIKSNLQNETLFDSDLTWTLKNVSQMHLIASSPVIYLKSHPEVEIRINFYPKQFYSKIHTNTVAIDLTCSGAIDYSSASSDIEMLFRLSILDEDGEKLLSHDGQAKFRDYNLECSCPLVLSPKYLARFTQNDKLILLCQIKTI